MTTKFTSAAFTSAKLSLVNRPVRVELPARLRDARTAVPQRAALPLPGATVTDAATATSARAGDKHGR